MQPYHGHRLHYASSAYIYINKSSTKGVGFGGPVKKQATSWTYPETAPSTSLEITYWGWLRLYLELIQPSSPLPSLFPHAFSFTVAFHATSRHFSMDPFPGHSQVICIDQSWVMPQKAIKGGDKEAGRRMFQLLHSPLFTPINMSWVELGAYNQWHPVEGLLWFCSGLVTAFNSPFRCLFTASPFVPQHKRRRLYMERQGDTLNNMQINKDHLAWR